MEGITSVISPNYLCPHHRIMHLRKIAKEINNKCNAYDKLNSELSNTICFSPYEYEKLVEKLEEIRKELLYLNQYLDIVISEKNELMLQLCN